MCQLGTAEPRGVGGVQSTAGRTETGEDVGVCAGGVAMSKMTFWTFSELLMQLGKFSSAASHLNVSLWSLQSS